MRKFLLILMLPGLLTGACRPGAGKEPEYQFVKGFGDSKEDPVGEPFVWPAGTSLVDRPNSTEDCF